jgi:ABC-type polysaccharide/polyol phosphate export permease
MLFVLIALFGFHHSSIPPSFILFPLLIFFQLMVAVGLALPITSLSVFYYDTKHALPIALATLFYASPVFYPVSLVPESIRSYYMINPIAGILKLYHIILYEGNFPPPALFGGVFVYSALIFLAGYVLFRRYETVYAEIV